MEIDELRELKDQIVKFVMTGINERSVEMKINIDYEGNQYNTEMLVQHEPNKSPRAKRRHGTYKTVKPEKE